MKIILAATKINVNGGGENLDIILMAQALKQRGHEVTLLTLLSKANVLSAAIPFRVIEEDSPKSGLVALQLHAARAFKKHQREADVFYLVGNSFFIGAGWYRFACRKSRPVVIYLNGYADFVESEYKKPPLYPPERIPERKNLPRRFKHWLRLKLERSLGVFLANRLDAIAVMTAAIGEYYLRAGVKKEKITVVRSFIDVEALRQSPRRDNPFASLPADAFHLLFTGRLHFDKGVDILIKAFSLCCCPKAILHLVGDGPEKADLERLAVRFGLSDKLIFHGWKSLADLIPYYQSADLFVNPARLPEPLIRTTVEALAFGLPLVAAETSGEDWLKGVAKLFVLSGNERGLAEAIERAYADKNFRRQARANGLKKAKEFDYREQIIKLDNIFSKLYAK